VNTIHGFADGDTVTDTRNATDGALGTVRFLSLTDGERATGKYAEAEVSGHEGRYSACELTADLAQHLIRTNSLALHSASKVAGQLIPGPPSTGHRK